MNKKLMLGVAAFCAMGLTGGAWAADAATADEVVAKTKEAAAAVKAGGDSALAEFDKKDGKWAWKDTYVFVMDCTAGVMSAHPSAKGKKLTEIKDTATGKEVGPALCDAAKGAQGGWVEYMYSKPGAQGNHRKISYTLSAGKYVVGAGVYDDKLTATELAAKIK
jgi:signal transduction histidine kinase